MKKGFTRSVIWLASSTILSQVVNLVGLIVICRQYEMADYGHLATFQLVIGVVAPFLTLRLTESILLVETAEDKDILRRFCCMLVLGVSLLVLVLGLTGQYFSLIPQDIPAAQYLLFLIPCLVIAGLMEVVTADLTLSGDFSLIAQARFWTTCVQTLVSIFLGFINSRFEFLLLAYFFGIVAFLLACSKKWDYQPYFRKLSPFEFTRCRELIFRYRRYILFSVPSDVLNCIGNLGPGVFIARFAVDYSTGLKYVAAFSMCGRILGIPLQLVGRSIGEVFRRQAALAIKVDGNCKNDFNRVSRILFSFTIVPFICIALFSPFFAEHILGDKWSLVGEMIPVLVPLFFFRLLASPLSSVISLVQKQHFLLVYDILVILLVPVSFWFAHSILRFDMMQSILVLACMHSFLYVGIWGLSRKIAYGH